MTASVAAKASKDKDTKQAEGRSQEWLRQPIQSDLHADILTLQRAAGNRAVTQLLQSGKDHSATGANEVPPIIDEVLRSPGEPLDPATRAFMESRFGCDFSQVRVHTGRRATQSAQAVGARAYTVGREIVFREGQYAPGALEGRRLLAHELAHVVQQGRGGSAPALNASAPHEHHAAAAASSVTAGQTMSVQGATGVGLARDDEKPMPPAHAGGEMGERDAAFVLGKMGFEIIVGPGGKKGHKLTTRGFDIVAVNPKTGQLWIVDNKSAGGVRKIQDASALTKNLVTNLTNTISEVQELQDFPRKTDVLQKLNAALNAVKGDKPLPKAVRLKVTNAGGFATGVGSKLARQGVEFVDVVGRETIEARKADIRRAKAEGKRPGRPVTKPERPATTARAAKSRVSARKATGIEPKAATPTAEVSKRTPSPKPPAKTTTRRGAVNVTPTNGGGVKISSSGVWSFAGKVGTAAKGALSVWGALGTIDDAMKRIEKAQTGSVRPEVAQAIKAFRAKYPKDDAKRIWVDEISFDSDKNFPKAKKWLHNYGANTLLSKNRKHLETMGDHLGNVRNYAWDLEQIEKEYDTRRAEVAPLLDELEKRTRALHDIAEEILDYVPYMLSDTAQSMLFGVYLTFKDAAKDLGRFESILSMQHWTYDQGYRKARKDHVDAVAIFNFWAKAYAIIWEEVTGKKVSEISISL